MKKLLLIAITFIAVSCRQTNQVSQLQKPFIIVCKNNSTTYEASYVYQDANGNLTTFYDYIGKYNVGDTLK